MPTTSELEKKNLALWNQVSTTDPKTTKKVKFGSRKFTAVDPQVQLKNATELWGPYGKSWGIKNIFLEIRNNLDEKKTTLLMRGVFYSPVSEFEYAVDQPFRSGDDTYKKAITSFRSKCLSMLGFNSDVFEGLFDDVGYVRDAEFAHAPEEYQRTAMLTEVENCQDMQSLKRCRTKVDALFSKEEITKSLRDEVYEAMEIKRKAFCNTGTHKGRR